MTEPEHTYPPAYPPGTHWAIDEAWAILDTFKPGTFSDDNRFLLAGMIWGTLIRVRHQALREGQSSPPPSAMP